LAASATGEPIIETERARAKARAFFITEKVLLRI
jgi:hypothetical protein